MRFCFTSLLMVTTLSGLFYFQSTYAQSPSITSPLSLAEAIQIALEKHPDVGAANQSLQKSKMTLKEAQSELFPRLDIISDNNYTKIIEKFELFTVLIENPFSGDTYLVTPQKNVPDYRTDLSLRLTERLFTGGRLSGTIEAAKARISVEHRQKQIKQRAVIRSTIKAYWELKRAEHNLEIDREKVKQSGYILEVAANRYGKGAISGLEKEEAEVDFINNRGDLVQAETAREQAENNLLLNMGILEAGREVNLVLLDKPEYDFIAPDKTTIEQDMQKALSLRPEVRQIKARILTHQANIKAARANYYPQVDLLGQYSWIGYSNESLDDSWADLDKNYWSLGLNINLTIFEGLATKSKVSQAKSDLSVSQLEMEKQRQIIACEVKDAYSTLLGAAERVTISQKNITLAEKNLKAAQKEFELGATTIHEVADYNLSLANTRRRYMNALIDFEIARAELKWAKGEELF